MITRQQLESQFIELRNASMKRATCARTRKIYYDHLNDSDTLAKIYSDQELRDAIDAKRMLMKFTKLNHHD